MQTKIETYKQLVLNFVQRLGDLRFAGQVLFVIIVLMISWSGVKAIQANYGLQKQIASLQQQNDVQSLENTNLALQNQYFNTNEYLDLSARQNFGLANPGEKELVVPQSVALAYTTNLPTTASTDTALHQPTYQRNFQSWVDFFMHRQN